MSKQLYDLDKILTDARQTWETGERRKRTTVSARIGASIPWWLVIIAIVAFALSIPHTVEVFGRVTPVVGVVAPLFVEFGLLFSAANRYKLKLEGSRPHWIAWLFEVLVVVASVFVNGAGSLIAVVSGTVIADMPFEVIMTRLHELPIVSQVALVLVPFAGLMIPAGTWVAGEGLARLFLEERGERRDRALDEEWRAAAPGIEYEALYNALVTRGIPPTRAAGQAERFIAGRYHRIADRPPVASELSDRHVQTKQTIRQEPDTSDNQPDAPDSPSDTATRQRNPNASRDALRLLGEHPDWLNIPVRRLEEQTGIDKSAWSTAKRNFEGNGRDDEE